MNSSTNKTPKATTLRKTKNLNTPKGRFAAVLEQRKNNLHIQKEKLGLAKAKLENDRENVEDDIKKITDQQDLIKVLEGDLKDLDPTVSFLSGNSNQSALRQQMTLLQKTEADLRQQLITAQKQLDETAFQLKASESNKDDPEVIRSIENEFKERSIQVRMLREIFDTLKSEILTRENHIILIELEAVEHRKELEKANKHREELIRRRKEAERIKNSIVDDIKAVSMKRLQLSEKQKMLRNLLKESEIEKENLKRKERDLNDSEKSLKGKRDNFNKLKYELNQKSLLRVQSDIKKKEDNEEDEMTGLKKISMSLEETAEKNFNLELKLDSDERALKQKAQNLEIEKALQDKAWEDRKAKILEMISNIQTSLEKVESKDNLLDGIQNAQIENEKIKSEIDAKKAEIEEIRKQLIPDEELNKIKNQQQSQLKQTMLLEREINSKLNAVQAEERELIEDEEEMKQNKSVLEADQNLTKKHESGIDNIISICTKQIEDLKKKYQLALTQNQFEKEQ